MKSSMTGLAILLVGAINAFAQSPVQYGSNTKAGNYVEVNDIKMYYETYGKGEPLLLLHGNGGSVQSFTFQIPDLSKHFRVIAIDSRAQGRTTDSDKEITYASMAEDVAALIEKLKLGSVNIIGWSDGGNVGLELAIAHPQLVKKLVTFGANFSHEHFMADTARTAVMGPDDPIILKTREALINYSQASQKLSPNPERIPAIRKKLGNLIQNYPNITTEQLAKIACPTLVVVGDHDLISAEHALELFRSIPHAELCVVPGATHLVLWEQPELANATILRFLQKQYRDIDRMYFFR